MSLLSDQERGFATAISQLVRVNPFSPRREELERAALGDEFTPSSTSWTALPGLDPTPNQDNIDLGVDRLVGRLRMRFEAESQPLPEDLELYEQLVVYRLFQRYGSHFRRLLHGDLVVERIEFYAEFERDLGRFLVHKESKLKAELDSAHLFAFFYQVYRTYENLLIGVLGTSEIAFRIKAQAWEAIFGNDMFRYRRSLYRRMGEMTVLLEGRPGTGRFNLAQAIARSRYIPFDPVNHTFDKEESVFQRLNLSGLEDDEVERKVFGWCDTRSTHTGMLDACSSLGAVYLEEIDMASKRFQVKLLHLLESRTFLRLGDAHAHRFSGRLIVASSRDLGGMVGNSLFREDLFYRLGSKVITLPNLADQVADRPAELRRLVLRIARKATGRNEAEELTEEVMHHLEQELGLNYAWPGNLRELEQCVRQIILHGHYQPRTTRTGDPRENLTADLWDCRLSMNDVMGMYCTLAYHKIGNYQEAARRLQLDRRTVRARIDDRLLQRLAHYDNTDT